MTMTSTSVVPFNPASMAVALKRVSRDVGGPAAFLKMEKAGTWVFGISATEVGDEDEFIVNPGGFQHGHVAWGDASNKLGETMMPLDQQLPDAGPVPAGTVGGWQFQLGLSMVGAEDGTAMIYRTTSVGGKRAIAELAAEIGQRMEDGEVKLVPVIALSSESYKHAKYGKIFNPIITVVRWIAMPSPDAKMKDVKAAAKAPPVKALPAKAAAKRK
jgi:hypothetical protein